MGRLWAVLALCAVVTAQEPPKPSEDGEGQKRILALIEEITTLAASEPPILGIDTQLDAAEVVRERYAALARRFVEDAISRAQPLADPPTRSRFLLRSIRVLATLDLNAAEQAVLLYAGQNGGAEFLKDGWQQVLNVALQKSSWEEQTAAMRRALAAGAFAVFEHRTLLERARDKHRDEVGSLFASILQGFPAKPDEADIRFLVRLVRLAGETDIALTRQALETALKAVKDHQFGKRENVKLRYEIAGKNQDMKSVREALLFQIAAAAKVVGPDLFDTYQKDLGHWLKQVESLEWKDVADMREQDLGESGKKKDDEEDTTDLDVFGENRSLAAAIDYARAQKTPLRKFAALMEVLDRDDLPLPRKMALAQEAIDVSIKVKPGDERLIGQAMLTRMLHELGDLPRAGVAAQLLAESYRLVCRCEDASCDSIKGRDECAENVQAFAEYLRDNKIDPQSIGLHHRSLEVRLKILDLQELLGKN